MSQPDLIIHDEKDNVGVVVIEKTKSIYGKETNIDIYYINSKITSKIGLEKMCVYGTNLSLIIIFLMVIINYFNLWVRINLYNKLFYKSLS